MPAGSGLLTELRERLGKEAVREDDAALDAAASDEWPPARLWSAAERAAHRPLCIARPASAEQVAGALAAVAAHGARLRVRGGASAMTGTGAGEPGAVILDLGGLDRIIDFRPEDATIEAEAGIRGAVLEHWLAERSYTLGHDPGSLHLSTLGGWIATRSHGSFASKYGGIAAAVLGLQVATAAGRLTELKAQPLLPTGVRTAGLFIGAEGRLGVVTRARLRLRRLPERRHYRAYALPHLPGGLALIRRAWDAHIVPAMIRLYDPDAAELPYRANGLEAGRPLLLVCHEGDARLAGAELEAFRLMALVIGGEDLGAGIGRWWRRHRHAAAQPADPPPGTLTDVAHLVGFWSQLMPLCRAAVAALAEQGVESACQFGDFAASGGSLYVRFTVNGGEAGALRRAHDEAWAALAAVADRHGAGVNPHRTLTPPPPQADPLLTAIKPVLDPGGMFGPLR